MDQWLIHAEILWPAMVAGLLVLATHVPLGREVLQRGIIFLDLAIAQIAAFGVVIANTIGFGMSDHGALPPLLIGILAAIIGAFGLYRLRNLSVRVQESIIGILFILAATGSVLLLSADPHGGEQLKAILVGQILWFQPEALIPLFVCYAVVLVLWVTLKQKLGDWLFYPLFAITITLSTQVVGVYLVFASLIIPSLSTLSQQRPLIKAFMLGALSYAMGLICSALMDLPAGAAIVWCLALNGLVYWVFSVLVLRNK